MRLGNILNLCVLGLRMNGLATVSLPAFFSDHMVLQREKPLPIWGLADPQETVKVGFRGIMAEAATDAAGKWRVDLPAADAGGPFELVVSGASNTVSIADVLVGEVWIASGQSNMEWPMNQLDTPEGAAERAFCVLKKK